MKKKLKFIIYPIVGILVILIGLVLYFLFFFRISEVNESFITSLDIPHKNYKISAYYMSGGATLGNIIQLRKEYNSSKYDIIGNIRGYVELKNIELISDEELKVIAGFKGKFAKKPDTLYIKLN